ncbi:MAG: 1-acyl-sn-glycerol-3-phosphate acyltransferase, partial [Williamsia herbipolensis]|nr:1-acyl-sn-glycerol-3-phosphate acyltransferase [Williamsia herbipolensis]
GVFPEGTRGDGLVRSVFNGAGWLAVRTRAQVVPVAIRGTQRPVGTRRRFRPVVRIRIGESFAVAPGSGRSAVDAATALIQQRLSALVAALDAEQPTPSSRSHPSNDEQRTS